MTYAVSLRQPDDLDGFRHAARQLLSAGIAPPDVSWGDGEPAGLFAEPLPAAASAAKLTTVPRAYADLAASVVCHRDPQRWPLLYQALWRIHQGERHLMQQAADPLVHRLRRMAAAVRHDQHRMTAFVRFREAATPDGSLFLAWYEPRHHTLRRTSGFFIDRFASMRFSILTPQLTFHWNGDRAIFSAGMRREDTATEDAVEAWWRRYYAAIFNPARINTRLMQSHMPRHFWRDLPEARIVADLTREAAGRTERMIESSAVV